MKLKAENIADVLTEVGPEAYVEKREDGWYVVDGRINLEQVAQKLSAPWQPIATASKEAEGLLLWNGHWIGRGYHQTPNYEGDPEWFGEDSAIIEPPPTHWMPLPEPPEESCERAAA